MSPFFVLYLCLMIMTYVLMAVTGLISYYCFNNPQMVGELSHRPYLEKHHGQYYRLLSSGFVHGSMGHLLINMFVLYQFGGFIEQYFQMRFGPNSGYIAYFTFYIVAIVFANLGSFARHANNPGFSSIGASGVTSALVLVYCFFDPWQMFLFPPVPAILFAVLYIGYSHWASYKGGDNIDHQGHLWGAFFGVAFVLLFDRRLFSHFIDELSTLPF